MRKFIYTIGTIIVIAMGSYAIAQRPGPPPRDDGPEQRPGGGSVEAAVAKLLALDTNQDGKLSRDEVADARLQPLLKRADANDDGIVTKEELTALFQKEAATLRGGGRGGPGGPGGAGGPGGGPGGFGPGPQRGGSGPGGPPQQGQILPRGLQDELQLTDEQRQQVADLQKDVDSKLAKILTAEQRDQLAQARQRGPRGFGPPPGGQGGGDRPPLRPGDAPRDQPPPRGSF